jgi:hypothetical protein
MPYADPDARRAHSRLYYHSVVKADPDRYQAVLARERENQKRRYKQGPRQLLSPEERAAHARAHKQRYLARLHSDPERWAAHQEQTRLNRQKRKERAKAEMAAYWVAHPAEFEAHLRAQAQRRSQSRKQYWAALKADAEVWAQFLAERKRRRGG